MIFRGLSLSPKSSIVHVDVSSETNNLERTAASVDRSINVVPVEHRQPFFLPIVGGVALRHVPRPTQFQLS
jgi:hypothetical protein